MVPVTSCSARSPGVVEFLPLSTPAHINFTMTSWEYHLQDTLQTSPAPLYASALMNPLSAPKGNYFPTTVLECTFPPHNTQTFLLDFQPVMPRPCLNTCIYLSRNILHTPASRVPGLLS